MVIWTVFLGALASALIPVINIEAILALAAGKEPGLTAALVLAASVGQMSGKVLWYWGGMHVDRAPWVRKHLEKPRPKATLDKWHERAEGRPWFTAGLLFFSAAVGLPPYAVMAVLAGVLRVNFVVFLVTGFLGRLVRFWAVVAGTTALLDLW
jgi:membrane protein YqaA with SNARE-associated domain